MNRYLTVVGSVNWLWMKARLELRLHCDHFYTKSTHIKLVQLRKLSVSVRALQPRTGAHLQLYCVRATAFSQVRLFLGPQEPDDQLQEIKLTS